MRFRKLLRACSCYGLPVILSVVTREAQGQTLANYAVTRTTGISYVSINPSPGLPFNSWRYSGGFQQDDNRSTIHPIGFDFWYNGRRFTDFSLSTNGYIDFSASAADGGPTTGPFGYQNTQFSVNGGTNVALAPIYDDMTTQGAIDPLGTSLRYELSGAAPNRVLTVDWQDMAVYLNTTPSLNFQVKIYETTGIIEYIYGTMTPGTAAYSYSCGMNAFTLGNVFQLRTQQVANTTNFAAAAQNGLNTLPASNSRLRFTPPVPANPAGTLTFSAITQTSMTLNWANWAANEVGYVIYNSTDGVNYSFITQTAANATSANISGLLPSTTYFWRVCAVTEGALSNPLSGTQATLAGGTFISIATGNWNTGTTWNTGTVPTINDNVIINNGHTVTINAAASCNNLTVGQGVSGTLRIGNNNTARAVTVGGTLTINAGGNFSVNPASNITHTLTIGRDVVNNGTFDMAIDAGSLCNVTFNYAFGNQTVSGTGATNRYNRITVNKGTSMSNTLEFTGSTFTAAANFLTLTNGTFKYSVTGATTITPFNVTADIPLRGCLWMNAPSSTMSTTGGNVNVYGRLQVSNGTLNIGSAANQCIMSQGGEVIISGGALNVAGRLDRLNTTMLTRFSISGGTMTVPTVGSTSTTSAPFMMDVLGSSFTQTGGTIVIAREGGTGAQNLGFTCSGGLISTVTGGTLQIGNATTPLAQTMLINTISPVGNLSIVNLNATAQLVTNTLTVFQDVTMTAGFFNAANLNVNVGRNWTNTGGTYTPGTNTTTFNGTVAQSISRTGGETFNHVVFTNAGIKTLGSNITCNNFTLNAGSTLDVSASNFTINLRGAWANNGGTYNPRTAGTVNCNGTAAQTIGGTSITNFRHLTIANAAGVSLTADENLLGTLTLTTGMFTTTGRTFTLISDVNGTARIAAITGGDITGNIVMQRYLGPGPTGWRFLSSPVTGATLNDWVDDFTMSGFPGSPFPSFPFCSVYTYDELRPGIKDTGWTKPPNMAQGTAGNKGHLCWVGPVPITVDVVGPPKKFAQNFAVTFTSSGGALNDGWNLVPNPYPSTIDWDSPNWVKTNMNGAIYVWNPNLQQYTAYVGGIGVNGGSNLVASSQCFWVQSAAAAPVLSCVETVKSAADQAFIRMSSSSLVNALRLNLSGQSFTDETIIRFSPSATTGFDPNEDAYKFYSSNPQAPGIASLSDTSDMAINSLPPLTSTVTIPVRVTVGISGSYTIARDTVMNMPPSACIVLEDLETGTMTDLTNTMSYTFTIDDTAVVPRFLIHIGAPVTKSSQMVSCPGGNDGIAVAQGLGGGPWDYTWEDSSGTQLAFHPAVNGPDTLSNLPAGLYKVTINGNTGLCGTVWDTIHVNGPMPFYAVANISGVTCPGDMNGSISLLTMMGGTAPYSYEWSTTDNSATVTNLAAGNYWVQVTDANGCFDTLHYTIGSVSPLSAAFTMSDDTVYVGQNNTVIFSNYTNGGTSYSWDFGDGSPPDVAPNPVHVYTTPGTYTVVLTSSDSLCTDTAQQVIVVYDFTGMNDPALSESVQVQQAQDGSYVSFQLEQAQDALIDVYDAAGRMVIARMQVSAFRNRVRLPLQETAEGIYLVRVVVDGKTVTRKLKL